MWPAAVIDGHSWQYIAPDTSTCKRNDNSQHHLVCDILLLAMAAMPYKCLITLHTMLVYVSRQASRCHLLDQVESRKRRFSQLTPPCGVLCARRAAHYSPTLPGAASTVLSSCPGEPCRICLFPKKQCLFLSQVCFRSYGFIAVWIYLWNKFGGSAGSSFSAHFWSTFQFPEGVSLFMCYFFTFCVFGFLAPCNLYTWCVVSKPSSFTSFFISFQKMLHCQLHDMIAPGSSWGGKIVDHIIEETDVIS